MNIRNVSELKAAHYTGAGSYNSTHLIAAPGANKHIAIYVVSNWSGASLTIKDADDVSDSGGETQFVCKDGIMSLDAPIILPANKGITVDQTGATILYTIINNAVTGGAY